MERLSGDRPVPAHLRGGVLALGNFDGFHVGHQAVVGRARDRARAEGRPALVVTFDPHPARFFRPEAPPFLLTSIDQRLELFAAFGMDAAVVLRFDATLAALSPGDFVARWLRERLGAAAVATGEDFTFGRGRAGNVATLAALEGIGAEAVTPLAADGDVASSTRTRRALADGDMAAAARLLSRPFTIRGIVQHGDKIGRTLGYPTANTPLGPYVRPAYGIYAVRGRLADGRVLDGAANLGVRPQFDPPRELLEPHFFDFAGDLYGQSIDVELIERLRGEARFTDLPAMVRQMEADCDAARRVLAAQARPL